MQFYIKIQLYVRYNASQVLWVKCYLVGSTVFWTLFYYILGKVLRLLDRKIMDADVNGPWFFAQLLHKPLFLSLKKYIISGANKIHELPSASVAAIGKHRSCGGSTSDTLSLPFRKPQATLSGTGWLASHMVL